MALDTFVFAIVLPPAGDSLPLFEELSRQMSRYIGLPDDVSNKAAGALNRLVAERLEAGAPVEVIFERPHVDAPITIDIVGPSLPGDAALAATAGATLVETDDARSRLRFSWIVGGE
jgi:hypothetical protein